MFINHDINTHLLLDYRRKGDFLGKQVEFTNVNIENGNAISKQRARTITTCKFSFILTWRIQDIEAKGNLVGLIALFKFQ